MSLYQRLRQWSIEAPERIALAWSDGRLSYAELLRQIDRAVELLRAGGARVIALDVDNGPAWVVLDIAALQLGLCVVPLPAFFSDQQVRHALSHAGVDAVISDRAGRLRERAGQAVCSDSRTLEILGQRLGWVEHRGERVAGRPPAGIHKLTFTSGTTGEPKGVMLDWARIAPVVESLVTASAMGAGDRHLVLLPLAVLLENLAGVYAPLWAGACVVLEPLARVGLTGSSGLNSAVMVRALIEQRASTAIFTPQTLQALVETLEQSPRPRPALRFAAVGGAALSPRLLQRAAALGLPVFQGYGMSECASVVCLNTADANRPGSVGRPLPHLRVRIADDGEVLVEGVAPAAYLGHRASTDTTWHTGDLGEIDGDGFVYLHGRRDNLMINSFGRNLAPDWVERELLLEPAIAQVAVFGDARPYNVAVVVSQHSAAVAAAVERVNLTLPDYARVRRWIVAEHPFTPVNGLLTGTGRNRRDAILARYGAVLDELYREAMTS